MSEPLNDITTRRAFLRSAGRYAVAAGIVGVTVRLAVRDDAKCQRKFVCSDCASSRDCTLPQADAYRRAKPEVPPA